MLEDLPVDLVDIIDEYCHYMIIGDLANRMEEKIYGTIRDNDALITRIRITKSYRGMDSLCDDIFINGKSKWYPNYIKIKMHPHNFFDNDSWMNTFSITFNDGIKYRMYIDHLNKIFIEHYIKNDDPINRKLCDISLEDGEYIIYG